MLRQPPHSARVADARQPEPALPRLRPLLRLAAGRIEQRAGRFVALEQLRIHGFKHAHGLVELASLCLVYFRETAAPQSVLTLLRQQLAGASTQELIKV